MSLPTPSDLVVRGGRVLDGTGAASFRADVGIQGDRISAIGELSRVEDSHVLDADGLIVAPGFIDLHLHADLAVLVDGQLPSALAQGVTTVVIGQDGLGVAPLNSRSRRARQDLRAINGDPGRVAWDWTSFGSYLRRVRQSALGPNVAVLASHGTIRLAVMGEEARTPTNTELDRMRRLVASAMRSGAAGLSSGLTYAPATFADDDELIALCSEMVPHGGYYAPHHRSYGARALEEYEASIEIGRRARVPVHLTHAHLSFPMNAGRAPALLDLVDRARDGGMDVTLDSYPYLAGSTYLTAFLPSWAQIGGRDAIAERLISAQLRDRIDLEMRAGCDGLQGVPVDWTRMSIAGVASPGNRWCIGLTIVDIGRASGQSPFDAFCRLVSEEGPDALALLDIGHEENVRQILQHPAQAPASDGILVGQRPHPRAWGTFARCLAHYVREEGIVSLEEMVRKMTSVPASRLGLSDRGIVRVGAAADLVVFDPAAVADRATYATPREHPSGVAHVVVNGRPAVLAGELQAARSGRLLRRTVSGLVGPPS